MLYEWMQHPNQTLFQDMTVEGEMLNGAHELALTVDSPSSRRDVNWFPEYMNALVLCMEPKERIHARLHGRGTTSQLM